MLLLSFSLLDVIEFNSSRVFLLHPRLISVITIVKSFSDTFLISQIKSSFLDVSCNLLCPALSIIYSTGTDCMFFCSITAVILVDGSFMSSFAMACSCFCSSSLSLLLLAAEGVSFLFFSCLLSSSIFSSSTASCNSAAF